MSISSDGQLIFGFEIGEEDEKPDFLFDEDGEEIEFDDFICNLAGLTEWHPDLPNADEIWEKRSQAIKSCPVDLATHCSYDYPMYILAVRGERFTAWRGHTVEIDTDLLKVSEDSITAMKEWCGRNNIEFKEPKWLLCSMYG